MKVKSTESELRSTLEALETALVTPVVPGELADWAERVLKTWSEASPLVCTQISVLHAKQYAEMTREDPELFAKVEKLKGEDAALEEDCAAFDALVARLANLAPLVEPDEGKFHALVEELQKRGVHFITRMRKQLVAVQTWYQEAFIRDRGVAD